ncbi:MAG: DUF378 domain-containing protein [Gemmatimonas sp.]|nr:DUF378 domain-containing protein [Gemmatimonadaceae bacterium]
MKNLDLVATILLVVGGLNWGLVGAANFDLVAAIFGPMSPLSRIVYVVVGLAALYRILQWKSMERRSLATAR